MVFGRWKAEEIILKAETRKTNRLLGKQPFMN